MMSGLRPWLNPRCVFVALLLIAAPGAALGHLVWTWVPARVAVAQLRQDIALQSEVVDREQLLTEALRARSAQLEQSQGTRDASTALWLPRRDRDGVFDQIAGAFRSPQIAIDRLTLDEPGLYAAAARSNLLACERVALDCSGEFTGLTQSLDRLASLELPLRIPRLIWAADGHVLRLSLNLEVPFVPNDELRNKLADVAHLADEQDPNEVE